jgi:hypothetical protein
MRARKMIDNIHTLDELLEDFFFADVATDHL